MPVEEQAAIEDSRVVAEYRKIKIGDKSGTNGAPVRYKAPVVTAALKAKAGAKFEVDELVMSAIRRQQGLGAKDDVKGIPVRLVTDDISESLFVYRAIYNSFQRTLCKSVLGDDKAQRWFSAKDPGADKGRAMGGKSRLFVLNQPVAVDCNRLCSSWGKNGEKTDCSWHAILTMQLEHDPVFPQPTRYRTSGWTVIQHLRGSLNKIAAVTGGILANIPLLLVETQIESKTAGGEKRTHPVMTFMWQGTLTELREAAIAELDSRRRLREAMAGAAVPFVVSGRLTAGAIDHMAVAGDGEQGPPADAGDSDDFVDFDAPGLEVVEAPSAPRTEPDSAAQKSLSAMETEIAELRKRTQTTDRALSALYDKHHGDVTAVRDELLKLAGPAPAAGVKVPVPSGKTGPAEADVTKFQAGPAGEDKDPQYAEALAIISKPGALYGPDKVKADADDGFMFAMGDESDEPSETAAEPETEPEPEPAVAQAQAPEEPVAPTPAKAPEFDDWNVFDD